MRKYKHLVLVSISLNHFFLSMVHAQIFWTHDGFFGVQSGAISETSLDGSVSASLYDGLNRPLGIVADPGTGMIYWGEEGVLENQWRVARAPISGNGSIEVVYGPEVSGNVAEVAIKPATGEIFWAAHRSGIVRGSMDGTADATFLGGSVDVAFFLTLDPFSNQLLYSDSFGRNLYRMNTDGTEDTLLQDGLEMRGLTTDGVFLYYTSANGTVSRANMDGSEPQVIADVGSESTLRGIDVGPDGRLYFGGQQSSIWSVLPDGGDMQHITDLGAGRFWGISVIPEPRTYALIFGIVAGAIILLRRFGHN